MNAAPAYFTLIGLHTASTAATLPTALDCVRETLTVWTAPCSGAVTTPNVVAPFDVHP